MNWPTVCRSTYREAFIKNRYITRTFIMPSQREREISVRRKLNPIAQEFKGKNVLLVDDSIVRGTTSKQIVQLASAAGAAKVYFASAAPPVRFPNEYGIDMPSAGDLIAHGRSESEIAALIGADRLIYQDLDALIVSVREDNARLQNFECSIFDGVYIAGRIDPVESGIAGDARDHAIPGGNSENDTNACQDYFRSVDEKDQPS